MAAERRGVIDWTVGPGKQAAAVVVAVAAFGAGIAAWRATAPRSTAAVPAPASTAADPGQEDAALLRASAAPFDGRIDLNRAGEAELDILPGIGPALAARIIADREANGPFRSVDDLDRVKGIGERTIARLREHVVVRSASADPER